MRVELVDIGSTPEGDTIVVQFESAVGAGRGRWGSEKHPKIGERYSVELDVDGGISKYRPEFVDAAVAASICVTQGHTVLCGLLEAVDPDGMGYLRLGADCLVMIEIDMDRAETGSWVRLKVPQMELELTPISL
ncbi:MAG: hypothetical protein OXU20_08760 [Myxococcales bacterium]|nr:hypothetical protein [Myxococcales bacterium]MDD9964862.1 hypothetical protein [Myxococcales bacterium]